MTDIDRAADLHASRRMPSIYTEAEQLYAALKYATDHGATCYDGSLHPIVLDALSSYEAFKRGQRTLEVGP